MRRRPYLDGSPWSVWLPPVVGLLCSCDATATPAASPSSVSREPFHSARVSQQLDRAGGALQTRGFVFEAVTGRGFLPERGASTYELKLQKDRCHVVLAATSDLLSQLELRLFSAEGSLLAQSSLGDGYGAVYYCSSHPGVHYLVARSRRGVGLLEVREYSGPLGLSVSVDDLFAEGSRRLVADPTAANGG